MKSRRIRHLSNSKASEPLRVLEDYRCEFDMERRIVLYWTRMLERRHSIDLLAEAIAQRESQKHG